MPYIAEARLDIDVPPELVFDVLVDHPRWKDWMPPSFVVAGRIDGPHRVGKRFAIKVAGMPFPSTLEITRVDRPRAVAWAGGARAVLRGDHEFRITSNDKGGASVHSYERWSGVLARALRRVIQPMAEKVGREQLAGLATECRARHAAKASAAGKSA